MTSTTLERTPFGLEPKQRDASTDLLQRTLVDLIDLALASKQAHWNLVGPQFQAIHEKLDEVVDDVRAYSDEVAERINTLDVASDGRAQTVAKDSGLETFPSGRPLALEAASKIAALLDATVARIRESLPTLGEQDPISEDLMVEVARALEKHQWMLRSTVVNESK